MKLAVVVVLGVLSSFLTPATEATVSGWRKMNGRKESFYPGLQIKFTLASNGSDLYVTLDRNLTYSLQLNVCDTKDCKGLVYSSQILPVPSTNESKVYYFPNAIPPWQPGWVVGHALNTTNSSLHDWAFAFYSAPGATNYSLAINPGDVKWQESTLRYSCHFVDVNSTSKPALTSDVSVPSTNGFWTCNVPTFDQGSTLFGTPFLMQVFGYFGSPTELPSLSGDVVYYTNAYASTINYSGCLGTNTTVIGQFSMANTYACSYTPIGSAYQWFPPVTPQLVVCPVPQVTGAISDIIVWQSFSNGVNVVGIFNSSFPPVRTCTKPNDDGDDGIPYWVWIIVGVGAAAAVVVVIAAAIAGVIWYRRHHGYDVINN